MIPIRTVFDWVTLTLVITGGLFLGAVGIWGWDLVNRFEIWSSVVRIVNILIGLSAAYMVYDVARKR